MPIPKELTNHVSHKLSAALGLIFLFLLPAVPASALAQPALADASVFSAAADESGIGIRLLDVPAATQDNPRARSYIIDNLPPGTTIERRVQVQNNTTSNHSVQVYAGAAKIEGNAFHGEDGAAQNELTTWISVDRPQLDMAPGESADVLVTIAVPQDAPEGEQYAAIWAEVRSESAEGSNIVSASRAGVRVYLSVGPGNGPPADFTIESLTANRNADGDPELVATVTNTGGRAVDISGELILEGGPGGLTAGPFSLDESSTIAPGKTGNVTVTMDKDVPNGPWSATLKLKSGLIEHEATADITFPEAGAGETVTPDSSNTLMLMFGIGAVLIIAAATAILALRQRRLTAKNTSKRRRH
ncbi:COG1361 family protein [Homoserinimonas sp. A520]